MFSLGGAVQDPNRRDSILREKRRRLERRVAVVVMAIAAILAVGGLLSLVYGVITRDGGQARLAVGLIGAGGFFFGAGYLGHRVSQGDL